MVNFKKILTIGTLIVAILNLTLLALRKVDLLVFWITIIICAIMAWFVIPKMK